QNLDFAHLFGNHPSKLPFIPVFFITVACGIMSGFHSTQATLISRTMKSEKEGRTTFFNMMLVEGFIAMCWAAGAMILFGRGTDIKTSATLMIGLVSREFLGPIGAIFAIAGVIVLPITSGDTAFRSLRLMLAETFHIDQANYTKRVTLTAAIFAPAVAILYYAKSNTAGFNILWRYFAFTNQSIAVFALAMVSVYLLIHGKNYLISLIPGTFYCFVVLSYIFHAPIGFGLESRLGMDPNSYTLSYGVAAVCCALYVFGIRTYGMKQKEKILGTVLD
ncbi:MAG: carbon starvation protein A, partial [Youngiibacter sp.]|nr:carbon starvation protein A [Youngiibacter sp.]